jgi:transcriptional regulator with XRE-family HTH domain
MNERIKRAIFIANKIKVLRGLLGWSQAELSRQAGITSAAVSQIEKGDRIPSLIVSRKLADALNVSVAELTGDTPLSSAEINEEAQTFFRKFGDIKELNETDQMMLQSFIKRLKDKNDGTT